MANESECCSVNTWNTSVLLFLFSGFGSDWWQTPKAAWSAGTTGQHCQYQHPAETPEQLWTGHTAAGHTSIVTHAIMKVPA